MATKKGVKNDESRVSGAADAQDDGATGGAWLDLVFSDLEGSGYACAAIAFPSSSIGAPHIRDRLYWVGDSISKGLEGFSRDGELYERKKPSRPTAASGFQLEPGKPGPTNGFWAEADWLRGQDGLWRPVEASPQPLADGSAESLGRVRAEVIAEIEKEINASTMEREIRSAETLRALWCALRAQAPRVWTPGRIPGLHEAPFLLAFLRQLTEQGWRVEKSVSLSCAQTSCGQMRSVRHDIGVASSPCERGLEGQPTREPADAVHFLSSLLARHAHSAWGDAYAAYAEIGFPLGHNVPSRVGRLRSYGNAINAEAAKAFIESYLES